MYRTAMTLGLAVAVGLGGVSSANAGLLDFLFGWAKRPPAASVAAAPHPDLTLSPAKPRRTARAKPKTPRAPVQISPKDMLARTIDPAKNPNWYLEDPTLRRGDILVLSDRVLVFKGGPIGVAQNYAALSNTKLLTRKERLEVALMTGHAYDPPMLANNGPRQPSLLKSASLTAPALPPMLGAARTPRT